ncbi:MAG: hypothetical protein K6G25_06480 [Bacteroidales bacterium]|nr:hypothetical protein [Bacteroidales bacterium]
MQAKDFDAQASYEYYICKDVDDRGELIHIRFVEHGTKTEKLLEAHGYVLCFNGCNAVGYELPGYRKVLVWANTSSEGEAGSIIATQTKDLFDDKGIKRGTVWDTTHSSFASLPYQLIQKGYEYNHRNLKVVYLEDKYVEVFERIKEERYQKGISTRMTYEDLWAKVDYANMED